MKTYTHYLQQAYEELHSAAAEEILIYYDKLHARFLTGMASDQEINNLIRSAERAAKNNPGLRQIFTDPKKTIKDLLTSVKSVASDKVDRSLKEPLYQMIYELSARAFITHELFEVKKAPGHPYHYKSCSYSLKAKESASAALDAILSSGTTVLDCTAFQSIIPYKVVLLALRDHYGLEQGSLHFDRLFGDAEGNTPEWRRLTINQGAVNYLQESPYGYYGEMVDPTLLFALMNRQTLNLEKHMSPKLFSTLPEGVCMYIGSAENYLDKHPGGSHAGLYFTLINGKACGFMPNIKDGALNLSELFSYLYQTHALPYDFEYKHHKLPANIALPNPSAQRQVITPEKRDFRLSFAMNIGLFPDESFFKLLETDIPAFEKELGDRLLAFYSRFNLEEEKRRLCASRGKQMETQENDVIQLQNALRSWQKPETYYVSELSVAQKQHLEKLPNTIFIEKAQGVEIKMPSALLNKNLLEKLGLNRISIKALNSTGFNLYQKRAFAGVTFEQGAQGVLIATGTSKALMSIRTVRAVKNDLPEEERHWLKAFIPLIDKEKQTLLVTLLSTEPLSEIISEDKQGCWVKLPYERLKKAERDQLGIALQAPKDFPLLSGEALERLQSSAKDKFPLASVFVLPVKEKNRVVVLCPKKQTRAISVFFNEYKEKLMEKSGEEDASYLPLSTSEQEQASRGSTEKEPKDPTPGKSALYKAC